MDLSKIALFLFVISLFALPATAQGLFEGELFGFLIGEDGLLEKLGTFFEDDYVQYFGALISIAFVVGAGVKAAMGTDIGPFGTMSPRQKTGIAFIFGIATANGIFFFMRGITVGAQASIIWSSLFAFIGYAGALVIPYAFYRWAGRSP